MMRIESERKILPARYSLQSAMRKAACKWHVVSYRIHGTQSGARDLVQVRRISACKTKTPDYSAAGASLGPGRGMTPEALYLTLVRGLNI